MGITGIAWDRDEWVAAEVMFSTDTSKCGGKFSRANVTVLLFLKCAPVTQGTPCSLVSPSLLFSNLLSHSLAVLPSSPHRKPNSQLSCEFNGCFMDQTERRLWPCPVSFLEASGQSSGPASSLYLLFPNQSLFRF